MLLDEFGEPFAVKNVSLLHEAAAKLRSVGSGAEAIDDAKGRGARVAPRSRRQRKALGLREGVRELSLPYDAQQEPEHVVIARVAAQEIPDVVGEVLVRKTL